jgi:hypothetical protein
VQRWDSRLVAGGDGAGYSIKMRQTDKTSEAEGQRDSKEVRPCRKGSETVGQIGSRGRGTVAQLKNLGSVGVGRSTCKALRMV